MTMHKLLFSMLALTIASSTASAAPCWAYSPSGAKIAEHNTCSPTAISAQAEMKLCPNNAGKWMDYTIQTMGNPTRKAAKVYCNATTKDANVERYKEGPKKTDNTAVRRASEKAADRATKRR
jgi:hypothetical protein